MTFLPNAGICQLLYSYLHLGSNQNFHMYFEEEKKKERMKETVTMLLARHLKKCVCALLSYLIHQTFMAYTYCSITQEGKSTSVLFKSTN